MQVVISSCKKKTARCRNSRRLKMCDCRWSFLSSIDQLLCSACNSVSLSSSSLHVHLTSVCSAAQYWLIAVIAVAPQNYTETICDPRLYKPRNVKKSVFRKTILLSPNRYYVSLAQSHALGQALDNIFNRSPICQWRTQ